MEKTGFKWRRSQAGVDPEDLLERYYGQLLKWGIVLARGNSGVAQDIVHDLCLHFTLAKPDLSLVANLDGYLYTCLRNIYLSAIARSSREATQFVSIAEFDSIHFALSTSSSDVLLQRQNDLRSICNYTMWRKDSSKSASYLILLFFHGYSRREVAEIACLPIAAIYNKLKAARAEVQSHLKDFGKLRIATRETPPEADLRLSPVSSVELFNELGGKILQADPAECIPPEALVNHYRSDHPKPISCSLLSHIVSCGRCLALIDRHFQRPALEDREPPEDFASPIDQMRKDASEHDTTYKSMMRSVHRQRDRVYEHRPRTLLIAVNGKTAAFHDVQGERSVLSSRVEHPDSARFVEVFTEQGVRLALLPIGERPPEGSHVHAQHVILSDDRWIELTINFDGLGLQSDVIYFDPALAVAMTGSEVDDESPIFVQPKKESLSTADVRIGIPSAIVGLVQSLRGWMPRPVIAWAILLVCFSVTGFLLYLYDREPLNANDLLNQSVRIETAELRGQAEHQIVRFEKTATDGRVVGKGTIDLWKEFDSGRYMRRLYNDQHLLLAAEWRARNGQIGSYKAVDGGQSSDEERALATGADWKQDLSAGSFRSIAGSHVEARAVGNNYELTSTGTPSGTGRLISATLILDHMLRPVSEIQHVRNGAAARELRFVQTNYEHRPASLAPESVFDPADLESHAGGDRGREWPSSGLHNAPMIANVRLVETQIAALHLLSKLGADTGEPIEVIRTIDGHVSVTGAMAGENRRQQIISALRSLPNQQLIEIRLGSQSDLRIPVPGLRAKLHSPTSVYNFAQTDAPAALTLRRYFGAKGWTGERLDSAVARFSQDAMAHTQRALQHAYALNRLGSAFTSVELKSIDPASERQWAEMVALHASALETELRVLDQQLRQIAPAGTDASQPNISHMQVDNLGDFAGAASRLLRQIQSLNRTVGNSFASGTADQSSRSPDALLAEALRSIPLQNATDMAFFATRLSNSEKAVNSLDQPLSRR